MGFFPVPNYSFRDVTDITPKHLKKLGVRFLMLDLDNTLASYSEHEPAVDVLHWCNNMKASGIELFMISNSMNKRRVEYFAGAFQIDFILKAMKPSPSSLKKAADIKKVDMRFSAMVGDQIFTDVLAAKRAGALSILVRPRCIKNPLLALRYIIELPFRRACKTAATNG